MNNATPAKGIAIDNQVAKMGRRIRGGLIVLAGCLAMATIIFPGSLAMLLVGSLLILCGILELFEIFRSTDDVGLWSAYLSGGLSIVAGILLFAKPDLIIRGMSLFVGGFLFIDGCNKLLAGNRALSNGAFWKHAVFFGVVNVLLGLMLLTRWPISGLMVVQLVVGFWMVSSGWELLSGKSSLSQPSAPTSPSSTYPDPGLGVDAHPEFARLNAECTAWEERRRSTDAYWCWMFVAVFFAIHVGRMQVRWNFVGMISPLVAVFGDVATSLLVAFGIVFPLGVFLRKMTRPIERRGWKRELARIDCEGGWGPFRWLEQHWLNHRFRVAHRMGRLRRSPSATFRWGLQVGLPVTAILIAMNPIWGFSWFFNSESWATEIWDRWAETRTDFWRANMIADVSRHYQSGGVAPEGMFALAPADVSENEDFSFLVLGDTGEGDASQFCLKDQFVSLGNRPDVKFLVVSSDVIYPSGAMSDYEAKFYLPFKGFHKPIYAIPGNHDWYDALEGFAANFFEPDAARASIRARIVADKRLTSTTESRVDTMIQRAHELRDQFQLSAGHQRGPFFEIHAGNFSLIAIDTGVMRTVDMQQWKWLEAALNRAKGSFTFVILGHPFYAGGRYQCGFDQLEIGEGVAGQISSHVAKLIRGTEVQPFEALHQLLRDHQVDVVMAGDTHYFEHYREELQTTGKKHVINHFVNGGGGAYISIGTPLNWPRIPSLPDCAFFPRTDVLVKKLNRETPAWKWPLWFWTRNLGAWPFDAETLAGAFDYNTSPYLQSFVEVRVEKSAKQVRILVHSATGPILWREMQQFGQVRPANTKDDDPVEFVVPLPPGTK